MVSFTLLLCGISSLTSKDGAIKYARLFQAPLYLHIPRQLSDAPRRESSVCSQP